MHWNDPSTDNKCIIFNTPLKFSGIFSYFNSIKPFPSELRYKDKLFITQESDEWNPIYPLFEINDSTMADHEGLTTNLNRR